MVRGLEHRRLGSTGLKVTEFCLGLLPMSPLQSKLPEETCVEIIRKALDLGVNFFDTAEMYGSQPYLGKALQESSGVTRREIVIATKSTAETSDEMARSVERSLAELDTDYIDIYHLHAARPSVEVFEQRKGALQRLLDLKRQKVIGAVGIATHNVHVAHAVAARDDIDVVFALVNKIGLGIRDGSVDEMVKGMKYAAQQGKGVYVMKALAGGNLLKDYQGALQWARQLEGIHAVSVGVVSLGELLQNLKLFGVETAETAGISTEAAVKEKKLFIFEHLCTGCGKCVETCPNGALFLEEEIARVDHEKCLLCGYCFPECPDFLIRLI